MQPAGLPAPTTTSPEPPAPAPEGAPDATPNKSPDAPHAATSDGALASALDAVTPDPPRAATSDGALASALDAVTPDPPLAATSDGAVASALDAVTPDPPRAATSIVSLPALAGQPVTAMQGAPPPAIVLRYNPPARPLELAAMLAIIALADLALYRGPGGAGLAVMFAGIPAILVLAASARRVGRRFVVISGLLALVAVRCLWQASDGATALGMAMLLPFAIALRSTRSFIPELVTSAFGSALGAVRQLGRFGATLARIVRPVRSARASWAAFYIPAGLVVVFGAIFAAANPVIQGWLGSVVERVNGLDWAPLPQRLVFWAGCAIAAAGLLHPVIRTIARLDARLGIEDNSEPTDMAPAASHVALARNVLIALNALFLGYNALDAVYLWGGHAPSGVNHTEYAHAGAAWLTVAFVFSTIVLGALVRGPIEHAAHGKLARRLAYVWAGQNFILAAGTFRRITTYIAYSGLTELRIVGVLGTVLTTFGLAIVVCKIARHRTMLWVMRRQLDALAVAVAVFVVTPTGAIAMRYNVARIAAAQYRPLLHLYEQPIRVEAIPALLRLLDHPDPVVREGVAVIAAGQRERLRGDDASATSWTDFEIARARARSALDDAAAHLAEVMPADRYAARAKLRGVAYGINDESELEGDEVPFDWRVRRYAPRP